MAAHRKRGRIYIASQSFSTDKANVSAGITRVREGHELLAKYPEWFVAVDDAPVHYEVEAASQGPGELRGDQ